MTAKLAEAKAERLTHVALKAIALAYVTFGEANPEIYRLMFASRLTPQIKAGSDLDAASEKAFELLRTAVPAFSSTSSAEDDA